MTGATAYEPHLLIISGVDLRGGVLGLVKLTPEIEEMLARIIPEGVRGTPYICILQRDPEKYRVQYYCEPTRGEEIIRSSSAGQFWKQVLDSILNFRREPISNTFVSKSIVLFTDAYVAGKTEVDEAGVRSCVDTWAFDDN